MKLGGKQLSKESSGAILKELKGDVKRDKERLEFLKEAKKVYQQYKDNHKN